MLKATLGITLEQKETLIQSQNGKCKICGNPMVRCYVDHDHTTGKIRGILCNACNLALGLFRDSLPNLKAAIAYLTPAP